jgi:hypothetical protein
MNSTAVALDAVTTRRGTCRSRRRDTRKRMIADREDADNTASICPHLVTTVSCAPTWRFYNWLSMSITRAVADELFHMHTHNFKGNNELISSFNVLQYDCKNKDGLYRVCEQGLPIEEVANCESCMKKIVFFCSCIIIYNLFVCLLW